jgi:hypothetical protein
MHRNLTLLKAQRLSERKNSRPFDYGASSQGSTTHRKDNQPGLSTEYYSGNTPLGFDNFIGQGDAPSILLNDTHSFIEAYSGYTNLVDNFHYTAGLGDCEIQDPFLWGSFGMDFTPNFSTQ